MGKVAGYVRVSTEDQRDHGISVEAQTAVIKKWVEENNKRVEYYIDAGFSARKKSSTRPELQRMLQDIRDKKIDLVVFTRLDRWFRNIGEYYRVQEVLEDNNVSWRALTEDYETQTASGRLKVNIMLSVHQDEADRDSERIKAVMQHKREKGEVLSGHVPYGYKVVDKHLAIDEDAAPVIKRFYELLFESRSPAKAILQLEAETGVSYDVQTAYKLRTREVYAGTYKGNAVPAYITPEQRAELMAQRGRAPRRSTAGHTYLFSGLMYCDECGARCASHFAAARKVGYEYRCRRHAMLEGCHNKSTVGETTIEKYMLNNIADIIDHENIRIEMEPDNSAREMIESEIAAVSRKMKRLKELYVADLIEIDDYKKDYEPLRTKVEELTEQLDSVAKKREKIILDENWKTIYNELDRQHKANFWASICEKIILKSDRSIAVKLK